MPAINSNLSKLFHSLMVAFVALSLGLSTNVNGRSLNSILSRRRHTTNTNDGAALDRRLHERSTYTRYHNKAAASIYNRPEQLDRLTLLLAYLMRNNNMVGSTRGKRDQCSISMESLVNTYIDFYDKLSSFLKGYPSHLQPAYATSALKDVEAILQLLPKDSKFISNGNIKEVKDGINKTVEITQILLDNGGRFVDQTSKNWFEFQQASLTFQITYVYLDMGCVVKESGSQHVQEEASGIGGGNTSKKEGVDVSVLIKIGKIATFLTQN